MYNHIAGAYKQTSRATLKTSNYAEFRALIKTTFNLSQDEVDFLLPKKAKCYQSKYDNNVITYSLELNAIYSDAFSTNNPQFVNALNTTVGQQSALTPEQQALATTPTELPLFFTTFDYLGNAAASAGTGKNGNVNMNKIDPMALPMIPTIFALWRLPSLLPPVYTQEVVMPKITGVNPTKLYTPGCNVPDLPDQFLAQAALPKVQSIFDLLPNNYGKTTGGEDGTYDEIEEEHYDDLMKTITQNPLINFNSPQEKETVETLLQSYKTKNNFAPLSTFPYQQKYFPYFFHNKSFNYILQPLQLRAVYINNNPYAVAVGVVDEQYNPLDTFQYPQKQSTAASDKREIDYVSPWSKEDWLPIDVVKKLFNIGDANNNNNNNNNAPQQQKDNKKQNNKKNNKATIENVEGQYNGVDIHDELKWPRQNNPYDKTMLDTMKANNDDDDKIIHDIDIQKLSKTTEWPQHLELIVKLFETYLKTQQQSQTPQNGTIALLYKILTNDQNISELFPINNMANTMLNNNNLHLFINNTTKKVLAAQQAGAAGKKQAKNLTKHGDDAAITNTTADAKTQQQQQELLTSYVSETCLNTYSAPSIGFAAGHEENQCDLSHFFSMRCLAETRPYPQGCGLNIIHCLNDTLSQQYKQYYPTDGFVWTSATKCVTKPHSKYILVQKCVFLLLNLAWLLCVAKPYMKISKSALTAAATTTTSTTNAAINNKIITPGPKQTTTAQTADESDSDDDDDGDDIDLKSVEKSMKELSITNNKSQQTNENDVDGEIQDDDEDEDDSNANNNNTPIDSDDVLICKTCFNARFEWGFQFVLDNGIEQYPCNISDIPKYLRATSACPSAARHVFSKPFVTQQSTLNKNKQQYNILCTCTQCQLFITKQQQQQRRNAQDIPNAELEQVVNKCLCATYQPTPEKPHKIDLTMNNNKFNNSQYHKITQLIKYAEKAGWCTTKQNKSIQQIVSKSGKKLDIRVTLHDKKYFEKLLNNPNSNTGYMGGDDDADEGVVNTASTAAGKTQAFQAATIQLIHGVKITEQLKKFLETTKLTPGDVIQQGNNNNTNQVTKDNAKDIVLQYNPLITQNFNPNNKSNNNFQSIGPLQYEMTLLSMIAQYQTILFNKKMICCTESQIKKFIHDYIRLKKLTIVIQNGKILGKPAYGDDHASCIHIYPPIAQAIINGSSGSNNNKGGNQNNNGGGSDYRSKFPTRFGGGNQQQQQQTSNNNKKKQVSSSDDSDDDERNLYRPTNAMQFSDDEDDIDKMYGTGKHSAGAKAKEAAESAKQQKEKDKQQQKKKQQDQQQQAQSQQQTNVKGNGKPETYLCYDQALYSALSLSKTQNYTIAQIDTLINQQLTPMTSICTQRIWNIHRIATHYEFIDYLIQTYNIINDVKNVNGVGIGDNKNNNNNNNTNSKNLTHDQKEHTILLLQQQMVAMVKKATVIIAEQQQLLEKVTKNSANNATNPALVTLKEAKHLLDVIQIVNNTTGGNANDGNSNATNMKNFVLHEGMPALLPMINDLAFKQDKSITLTTPTPQQGNAAKTTTGQTAPANNKPTHQPPIASAALPTIMLHSARIKGNVVTFMVGLELFGISPKDLAANSHFKSFMGCAVTTVDIVAEPKMKQHFPATINPKCTFMVQMQGDQTTKAAKYAVTSLKIPQESIFFPGGMGKKKK